MDIEIPHARGPLSAWLIDHHARHHAQRSSPTPPPPTRGSGLRVDLQLALYLCYEAHYSDVPGLVLEEWDPVLIAWRTTLEDEFEACLLELVGARRCGDVRTEIPALIEADTGPSLSRHMETLGTLAQMRDIAIHRSAYQLKEADPHTFAIPRLQGRAKQILTAIQAGEYGADKPNRQMHSDLFGATMRSLGLDARRHAYVNQLPASAFMISNLISLFALRRRSRGALVGHLAVFEMTSVVPMGRYARGLRRLGAPAQARRFYEVHELADAEHEHMALEMADALVDAEPHLAPDVLFGARAVLAVERLFADELFDGWHTAAMAARAA